MEPLMSYEGASGRLVFPMKELLMSSEGSHGSEGVSNVL